MFSHESIQAVWFRIGQKMPEQIDVCCFKTFSQIPEISQDGSQEGFVDGVSEVFGYVFSV
jgi:hypothetical protein